MKNREPAEFSFISAKRPELKPKPSIYPFVNLRPGGNALLIKNRHIASVRSALKLFITTNPDYLLSLSITKEGVLVFRWKHDNEYVIKLNDVKSRNVDKVTSATGTNGKLKAAAAKGFPKGKAGKKSMVKATKQLEALTAVIKPEDLGPGYRKTGAKIINSETITNLHLKGMSNKEISDLCSISIGTIERALKVLSIPI